MARHPDYAENVFINCAFDTEFKPIFEAMVFAIYDCGFIARCALEDDNAAEIRISKILRIIDECKYGIHDISKANLDTNTQLARFNMPLELGLFLGAHRYSASNNYNKEKRALILDLLPYRYQSFISDIAGQDIRSHNSTPNEAINCVVDFLHTNSRRTTIPGPLFIAARFAAFLEELPIASAASGRNRDNLTFITYSTLVRFWIENHPFQSQ